MHAKIISANSFIEFLKYAVRKLDQGKFRGKDFFIRFFENDNSDIYCKNNTFPHQKLLNLGKIKISGKVGKSTLVDDSSMGGNWEYSNRNKSELCPDYSELLTQYELHVRVFGKLLLHGKIYRKYSVIGAFYGLWYL